MGVLLAYVSVANVPRYLIPRVNPLTQRKIAIDFGRRRLSKNFPRRQRSSRPRVGYLVHKGSHVGPKYCGRLRDVKGFSLHPQLHNHADIRPIVVGHGSMRQEQNDLGKKPISASSILYSAMVPLRFRRLNWTSTAVMTCSHILVSHKMAGKMQSTARWPFRQTIPMCRTKATHAATEVTPVSSAIFPK